MTDQDRAIDALKAWNNGKISDAQLADAIEAMRTTIVTLRTLGDYLLSGCLQIRLSSMEHAQTARRLDRKAAG